MADALDKAHRQGLTHHDLKPGNIMLTKAGAKLLDFGLCQTTPAAGLPGDPTGKTIEAGAPQTLFAAPVAAGYRRYDVTSDGQLFLINTRSSKVALRPRS